MFCLFGLLRVLGCGLARMPVSCLLLEFVCIVVLWLRCAFCLRSGVVSDFAFWLVVCVCLGW